MSEKKTWVRFKKSGAPHGYAYHEGDVAEIDTKKAEELTESGVTVPAKPAEIEKAKEVIEVEVAALAAKFAQHVDPEKIAMAKQIADLEAQLAAASAKK